jgi:hypothetical protein
MKNLLRLSFFSLVLLVSVSGLLAQTSDITVSERGGFLKHKVYTKCEIELTTSQLISLFSKDPDLKVYYKPMALTYAAGTILKSAGSLLVLWPVTESFYADTDPNWTLAYIGLGCMVLAIPFDLSFNKHAAKAVQYYNSRYHNTGDLQLNFGFTSNGIGLVMKF